MKHVAQFFVGGSSPWPRRAVALGLGILLASCQPTPPAQESDVSSASFSSTSSFASSPSSIMQSLILTSPDGRSIALQVEIADDAGEWEQGLMNRTTLADGMGMLFVFTDERPLQFWMKNTLIPLDVVFFDASGRFISMQTMEPCVDDPCATYPSDRPAKYALEVPAGFTVANGVGDGWVMMIGQ